MAANKNIQVLAPTPMKLPLKNAAGTAVPNGSPGVGFDAQFAADPGVKFSWRYLSPTESADYGVIVTVLSPGNVNVILSGFIPNPATGSQDNKVTDSQLLSASGTANFQQPHIVS